MVFFPDLRFAYTHQKIPAPAAPKKTHLRTQWLMLISDFCSTVLIKVNTEGKTPRARR